MLGAKKALCLPLIYPLVSRTCACMVRSDPESRAFLPSSYAIRGPAMTFKTLDDLNDIAGKRVLVRVDLNVPVSDGKVTDATRIERVAPTILELSDKGAKVILLAHFGRPKGEEKNTPEFTAALAANGDIFVNDACSAAHRAHASTEGLAHHMPAYAGRTMQAELEALEKGLGNPARPVVAIVGGAKVSTKIDLLQNLVKKVDALVIGGGMANTFLAAQGIDVGKSLCEHDLADTARTILAEAEKAGCVIVLPVDGVVAREFKANAANETVAVSAIPSDAMMLDVGPKSVEKVNGWIEKAATLVWNGPLGAFEIEPFDKATVSAAQHAAAQTKAGKLVSVAGGGDTVAAVNHAGVGDDFTYVSTAGGAFLEWMEGKPLPGVDILNTSK